MGRERSCRDGGGRPRCSTRMARQAPLGDRLSRQGTACKPGETLVSARALYRLPCVLAGVAAVAVAFAVAPARATTVERIVSPSGIVAWLVREPTVPMIALDFAFRGGANQDPANKPGVATMASGLLDEGAGDIDSKSFHERVEAKAIEISFAATRDYVAGSLRTLTEHQDEAVELLRLSLTAPRFDREDVERIRDQVLAGLRRATTSPNELASQRWWSTAFAGHPYGRPVRGTLESVPTITPDDLR